MPQMDLEFPHEIVNEVPPFQVSAHFILPTIPWFHLNPQHLSINDFKKMEELYKITHSSPAKRKVLGNINNTIESPVSPTANLKLLTKVAVQIDSIENSYYVHPSTDTPTKNKPAQREQKLNLNVQERTLRKYKSLGFLCDKFLNLYPLDLPEDVDCPIFLSDLACQLGVEKRRVYDIINVVESLQMATKVAKNTYTWTGNKSLADTLSQLKAWAQQVGLANYVRTEQFNRKLYLHLQREELESLENCAFVEDSKMARFFRNERRIGILCQKFVMLFLVSLKDGLINLDLAADALVGKSCEQNKTRLRRLYDIANILVSLGIIAKVDVGCSWKKPLFRYVGPCMDDLDNLCNENENFLNLFSNVKTEIFDGTSSDLSEDSCSLEAVLRSQNQQLSVTEMDHCYSLDVRKAEALTALQPAAKKRLVFTESGGSTVLTNDHEAQVTQSSKSVLKVLGQGNVPQSITNGGVYQAVKVGNEYHFIRLMQS